jgi:hypothetical protein
MSNSNGSSLSVENPLPINNIAYQILYMHRILNLKCASYDELTNHYTRLNLFSI